MINNLLTYKISFSFFYICMACFLYETFGINQIIYYYTITYFFCVPLRIATRSRVNVPVHVGKFGSM